MKLKAIRDIVGFDGKVIKTDTVIKTDNMNFNQKNFYKARLRDGDFEEIIKTETDETAIISNKKRVKKDETDGQ